MMPGMVKEDKVEPKSEAHRVNFVGKLQLLNLEFWLEPVIQCLLFASTGRYGVYYVFMGEYNLAS